jgi:hypothetical protein
MPTQTTQPAKSPGADNPLDAFHWKPQPEAERLVRELVKTFLEGSPLAERIQQRMLSEAGVRIQDCIDCIIVEHSAELAARLGTAGFVPDWDDTALQDIGFSHRGGIFPRVQFFDGPGMTLILKVERIEDFLAAWPDSKATVDGDPVAALRWAMLESPPGRLLYVYERHGDRGMIPRQKSPAASQVERHRTVLRTRPREVGEDDGFRRAAELITAAANDLGVDYACDLFFATEREYWMGRNRAAQVQYARQQRLGIGWANHDHHTYRSSRRHFARLISIFEKLGFHCRERFYAGRQAGWGAQVLEQPNAGIVIFADVDLSPDELLIDFAHEPLPERQQLGTVGLWCELHGESFLEAGMHHLECQFDFEALRRQLEAEAGIRTMKPFTDFPYLRQAFTEGERWPVREERITRLQGRGQITPEQAEAFRKQGAIGSHLENLERNEGFKGFNQTGVSEIIAATDPRKQLSTKDTNRHEG